MIFVIVVVGFDESEGEERRNLKKRREGNCQPDEGEGKNDRHLGD